MSHAKRHAGIKGLVFLTTCTTKKCTKHQTEALDMTLLSLMSYHITERLILFEIRGPEEAIVASRDYLLSTLVISGNALINPFDFHLKNFEQMNVMALKRLPMTRIKCSCI